jgi:hypothetical protein
VTLGRDTDIELAAAVRAAWGSDAALLEAAVEPLVYDLYLPGRTVERIVTRVQLRDGQRDWSVIRKWTASTDQAPARLVERARREALAYGSGLLDDFGALRAPRVYAVDAREGGPVELWFEDVVDDQPGPWSLATFVRAAEALGEANGHLAGRSFADRPWLVQDWAARQSEPVDEPAVQAEIEAQAADPRVRRAMGDDICDRAAGMLRDQPAFIAVLGRLPQTLCHHDAARSNLVATSTGIVAFDWESVGPGPLGAEIATLVSGSVRKGDAPAHDLGALDRAVFGGYLDGLRAAGWSGDERIVRLGFAMSLALRCWFVRDTLRHLAEPSASAARLGRAPDVRADDALAAFVTLSRLFLDRADEARRLSATLDIPLR